MWGLGSGGAGGRRGRLGAGAGGGVWGGGGGDKGWELGSGRGERGISVQVQGLEGGRFEGEKGRTTCRSRGVEGGRHDYVDVDCVPEHCYTEPRFQGAHRCRCWGGGGHRA